MVLNPREQAKPFVCVPIIVTIAGVGFGSLTVVGIGVAIFIIFLALVML